MFKALSSITRVKMLKLLAKKEMHIAGLARELGISVPVAAKHARILESSGLIERKKFGRTHVLRSKLENFYDILDEFAETHELTLRKGTTVLDALKKISGVEVRKTGEKEFVVTINGDEGLYIYEVDGKLANVSASDFKIKKNAVIEWKKLIPVTRKRISVKVK